MNLCRRCQDPIRPYPVQYCSTCRPLVDEERAIARICAQHGIAVEFYRRLWAFQGGRCAICQTKQKRMRLSLDHHHKSGRVRGLLCNACNRHLLKASKERVDILRAAIRYLEDPPAGRLPDYDQQMLPEVELIECKGTPTSSSA